MLSSTRRRIFHEILIPDLSAKRNHLKRKRFRLRKLRVVSPSPLEGKRADERGRERERENVAGVRVINAARLSTKRLGSGGESWLRFVLKAATRMFSSLLGAILLAVGGPGTRPPTPHSPLTLHTA